MADETNLVFNNVVQDDDELFKKGNERLAQILQNGSARGDNNAVGLIRAFADANEAQKRKLLYYCLEFVDPAVNKGYILQDEQICLHDFPTDGEIDELLKFVDRHREDTSFGGTVFRIMEEHHMDPPQVYKTALLRRQDFSRVTGCKCKNVTRRIAWQIIIGLHCSLEEADEVLYSAGYIRRKTPMDLTMQHFIERGIYDIEAIDYVLEEQGIQTLAR